MVHDAGLADGRVTVDLLRFSKQHGAAGYYRESAGFEFRAHKWQEPAEEQQRWFERVRDWFPAATVTGCKLDPQAAIGWVRSGLIKAMPCACWV